MMDFPYIKYFVKCLKNILGLPDWIVVRLSGAYFHFDEKSLFQDKLYRKDQAMHSGQLFTLTTTVYEFSLRMHPNRCRKCRKIMMDKWCMSIMIRKQF